ncbi:trypsin-like serine protease [Actinoplanes sp. NPDC024001]|uniref:S1 family peptidase n=1 Tax=Actinoplanes sp. NPDC024001 TaxID=3154598 RepID=UPI0033E3B677
MNRSKRMKLAGAAGSAVIAGLVAAVPASPASAIIGGFPASSGTRSLVPQVVRVNADNGWRDAGENCTGTLIAAQWVVTAQHCTNVRQVQGKPYAPSKMTVKVNASAGNRAQTTGVAEVWRMEGYHSGTLVHDVAVLKLKKAIADVVPARMAHAPIPGGVNAYVYGFGIVAEDSTRFRTLPRAAEVRVRTRAALSSRCAISDKYVLTTVVNGASAQGDSGGPLVEWSGGRPTLFAVTGGDFDSVTCKGGNAEKRSATWVGISTRVDRRSPGFAFLARHVPGLGR